MVTVLSGTAAVSELGRSAGSGRPVCKHSVEAGRESSSTADARRFFRVFRVIRGYIPSAVTSPVVTAFFQRTKDRRFLSDEHSDAEQGRCTEPPFALRTCALEFWILHESGLGGR